MYKSVFMNWYRILTGTKGTLVPRLGRTFPNFRPRSRAHIMFQCLPLTEPHTLIFNGLNVR
jgi:hypothetical protein